MKLLITLIALVTLSTSEYIRSDVVKYINKPTDKLLEENPIKLNATLNKFKDFKQERMLLQNGKFKGIQAPPKVDAFLKFLDIFHQVVQQINATIEELDNLLSKKYLPWPTTFIAMSLKTKLQDCNTIKEAAEAFKLYQKCKQKKCFLEHKAFPADQQKFLDDLIQLLKRHSLYDQVKIQKDLQRLKAHPTHLITLTEAFKKLQQILKDQKKNSLTGKLHLSKNCVGVYKRYMLCNDQPCPSNQADFRGLQCSSYNNVDFQGQQFIWEPYIKDDAECELNCKPVGMKYFATLNSTVIDGTPCERSAEFYRFNYKGPAICIEGICKAIHASGIITGLSANSGSVSCGGLLCRPITGLFTRDPLPDDAYIHVATIPAGASNISITELKNSMNLLVLSSDDDSYIINGDNTVSESGAYEGVGAIFDYHRLDGLHEQAEGVTEWVTCTGPIRENLELMIYSKSLNPGIKYEYLLPITSDSEENEVSLESDGFLKSGSEDVSASMNHGSKRRRFNWKVIGFSTCSKSCGGGTQTPIVRCVRENPLRYYSQRRCMQSEKPVINENLLRCNTQPCPAYWRLDDWGECHCHHGEGSKERELSCVQELASGIVIHVDSSACMEEKPVVKKPCECPKNRRRSNQRYRLHGLNSNNTHSLARRNERAGTWLMSDWNQYCSVDCGMGVEYRTIYCDRTKPNSERCDFRMTPEITRACERSGACEAGEWFSGPWSPCNGNCFNLTRTRQVLCIQSQLIVDDEDCNPELRPANLEKCSHEEVEYCGPRWHYSEWSECTKPCNTGTQRRSVKCLEYEDHENALRESNKCRYSIRESIYRSCNTHKCEGNRSDRIQNDGALTACLDEIANCQWAVKAKLCSYEYYQHKCCYSCRKAR